MRKKKLKGSRESSVGGVVRVVLHVEGAGPHQVRCGQAVPGGRSPDLRRC